MGVERTRTTAQATAEGVRVFLAGVPWHVGEDMLRRDFEECGVIEDLFVLKDNDGNSKGRAFITFRDQDAVQAALKFNDTKYGGRIIYVKLAEVKRGEEDKAANAMTAPLDKRPEGSTSLCLKNIGDAVKDDIVKFLDGCTVQEVRVLKDNATGNPRGIAFVDFSTGEDVEKAMKKHGKKLKGNAVDMRYVEAKKEASTGKRDRAHPVEKPEGCTSLCLKNLGEATVDDIWEFLDGCGVQSVRVVFDRDTGVSRGMAFVDFVTSDDVDKAMKNSGKALREGRAAVEMRYEAPKDRPRPEGCLTVAVKKVPANAMEEDIRKLFKGLKSISDVRVICDKMMACTGLVFVEFTEVADAEAAIRRDGMSVCGQTVFVCYETKGKKEEQEWQEEPAGAVAGQKSKPGTAEKEVDAEWWARQEGIQSEWEEGRLARQKERRKKKRAAEGHGERKKKRAGEKFFKKEMEAQKVAEGGSTTVVDSTEVVDSNLGIDEEDEKAAAKKAKKRLSKRSSRRAKKRGATEGIVEIEKPCDEGSAVPLDPVKPQKAKKKRLEKVTE